MIPGKLLRLGPGMIPGKILGPGPGMIPGKIHTEVDPLWTRT